MRFPALALLFFAACGHATPAATTPAPTNEVPEPTEPTEPAPEPPAPPSAWGETIPDGTGVKILEVGQQDAYITDAAKIVGLVCKVDVDLHRSDGAYYAGGARCVDGQSYYFYQVRVEPAAAPPESALAQPVATAAPITGTSYGATLVDGTTFTIVALSPEDAFYEDAAKIVNLSCTATSPMTETGTGLYGGSAKCSDGEEYTFYQVSVASVVTP